MVKKTAPPAPTPNQYTVAGCHVEVGVVHHSKHTARCIEALAHASAAHAEALKEIAKAVNNGSATYGHGLNIGNPQ